MQNPYWNWETCWWLLSRDGGCHAISSDLAATWADAGEFTVMVGSYADCKAVALARVRPETPVAEKPRRARKPRVRK